MILLRMFLSFSLGREIGDEARRIKVMQDPRGAASGAVTGTVPR
jgi:hypothetical protein